jgi:hypothetical protein
VICEDSCTRALNTPFSGARAAARRDFPWWLRFYQPFVPDPLHDLLTVSFGDWPLLSDSGHRLPQLAGEEVRSLGTDRLLTGRVAGDDRLDVGRHYGEVPRAKRPADSRLARRPVSP